jgi:hypothetical protein
MTLSITTLCHYAECHCAECRDLFIGMQNVIMLSVIMLNVVMLSVMAPLNVLKVRAKHCTLPYFRLNDYANFLKSKKML